MNYSIEELIVFLKDYAEKRNSTLIDYTTKEEVSSSFEKMELLEIPQKETADIIIKVYNSEEKILGIFFLNKNKKIVGKKTFEINDVDLIYTPEYVIDADGKFDIYEKLVGYPGNDGFRKVINSQKDIESRIEYFLNNIDDFLNAKWIEPK